MWVVLVELLLFFMVVVIFTPALLVLFLTLTGDPEVISKCVPTFYYIPIAIIYKLQKKVLITWKLMNQVWLQHPAKTIFRMCSLLQWSPISGQWSRSCRKMYYSASLNIFQNNSEKLNVKFLHHKNSVWYDWLCVNGNLETGPPGTLIKYPCSTHLCFSFLFFSFFVKCHDGLN